MKQRGRRQQQPTTAAAHDASVNHIRSATIRTGAATATRAPHLAAGGPPAQTWPPRPRRSSRASLAWPRSRSSTCRAGRRGEVGKTCWVSAESDFLRRNGTYGHEVWPHRSADILMTQLLTSAFEPAHLLPRMAAVLVGFACAAKTKRRSCARDSRSRPGSDAMGRRAARMRRGLVPRAGRSAAESTRTPPRRDPPGMCRAWRHGHGTYCIL